MHMVNQKKSVCRKNYIFTHLHGTVKGFFSVEMESNGRPLFWLMNRQNVDVAWCYGDD